MRILCECLGLMIVLGSLCAGDSAPSGRSTTNWEKKLRGRPLLFGHRNWIVIADSAYPTQSCDGIETVVSGPIKFKLRKKFLQP